MCRANGRRCPGEAAHQADQAWRDARNARRRARYAEKKTTTPSDKPKDKKSKTRKSKNKDKGIYGEIPNREFNFKTIEEPTLIIEEEPNDDYKMMHTAPTGDYGAPASDMISGDIYPDDFYDHPEYYRSGNQAADDETIAALKKIRGNPDALVTVYRAAPAGSPVNPGDWVTLSKTYATEHAMMDDNPDNDMPVHAITVRAGDLYSAGDINEFGWDPSETINRDSLVGLGREWPTEPPHPQTGWAMPKYNVTLPDGRQVNVEEYGDGVGQYGYNGTYRLEDRNTGEYLGHIAYQYSGDKTDPVRIAMIEVSPEHRGEHIADVLVSRLAHEYPQGIDAGMLTEDGARWWPGVAKRMGWS